MSFLASKDFRRMVLEGMAVAAAVQISVYLLRVMFMPTDSSAAKARDDKSQSARVLARLGSNAKLTAHEQTIACEVIHPEDISTLFSDIGGLAPIISSLRESVIFPLLFNAPSGLLGAPKGVLLFGPPGCGKTMLAKALAKESGATFINIKASILMDKWYGETNKLVSALFSLARKLQPSIIFIDEIDSFLRERTSGDHEISGTMKAEFMTLWDGLTSTKDTRILVLGATNRPNDIDKAILRRMPKRIPIALPDLAQRESILKLILSEQELAPGFDLPAIARLTTGFSGSDLKEACRAAAMIPFREKMRAVMSEHSTKMSSPHKTGSRGHEANVKFRPLRVDDFFKADLEEASGSTEEIFSDSFQKLQRELGKF